MGNQTTKTTATNTAKQSNRLLRTGLFHGMEILSNAADFVLKKRCRNVIDAPRPSKRLRPSKRKRRVHFNDNVQVRTIPHHSSYSEEERKATWRSKSEIILHAIRSREERKYEKKDWRNAPEESDMWFDIKNGIRCHPCWVMPRQQLYHKGDDMLYGPGNQRAVYSRKFFKYVIKYGTSAFEQED